MYTQRWHRYTTTNGKTSESDTERGAWLDETHEGFRGVDGGWYDRGAWEELEGLAGCWGSDRQRMTALGASIYDWARWNALHLHSSF